MGKQRFEEKLKIRQSVELEDLCKGLPVEVETYLSYCKGLGFTEKPDYREGSIFKKQWNRGYSLIF